MSFFISRRMYELLAICLLVVFAWIPSQASAANPIGYFDSAAYIGPDQIRVTGWAIDPDSPASPLSVHVYVDSHGFAKTANKYRPDVGAAYPGYGNYHGFDEIINVTLSGNNNVCAYGINVGAGVNVLLGCKVLTIHDFYGINAENRWGGEGLNLTQLEQRFQMINAMGAKSVRTYFLWDRIQPNSKTELYNWAEMDNIVLMAKKYNLKIAAVLCSSPKWAVDPVIVNSSDPLIRDNYREYPPRNNSTGAYAPEWFAEFARAAVKRYKPYGDFSSIKTWPAGDNYGITDWQIGNEINIRPAVTESNRRGDLAGVGWGGTIAQYTLLLNKSYSAVHAECGVYPACNVISGGVADRVEAADALNTWPYLWDAVNNLYNNMSNGRSAGYFDTLAVHSYEWLGLANQEGYAFPDARWYRVRLSNVISKMNSHGDSAKKIWLGETGYICPCGSAPNSFLGCLSEQAQADALVIAYRTSAEYSQVEKVFWWQDYDTSYSGGLGIIRSNLTPKPAYAAYSQLTVKVYGAIGYLYYSLILSGSMPGPGYPINSEYNFSNGASSGRAQDFYNGTYNTRIIWNSATGVTAEIHGPILSKYDVLRSQGNYILRFPTQNTTAIAGGYQSVFEGGRIYQSGSSSTAYAVYGAILATYLNNYNGPSGSLGFPISDEHDCTGANGAGRCSDFEKGIIYWTATSGTIVYYAPILNASLMNGPYWASYADYTSRLISIDYKAKNTGGTATNVKVYSASASNGVILYTSTPLSLTPSTLATGASSNTFTLKYRVPQGVTGFLQILTFEYKDAIGNVRYSTSTVNNPTAPPAP